MINRNLKIPNIFIKNKCSRGRINPTRNVGVQFIEPDKITTNIIGKIVSGIADEMLTTTVVSTTAPVVIAPAMNEKMWLNPVVQANVERLKKLGFHIVDPEYGPMACGGEGWGLASTPRIMAKLVEVARNQDR